MFILNFLANLYNTIFDFLVENPAAPFAIFLIIVHLLMGLLIEGRDEHAEFSTWRYLRDLYRQAKYNINNR
jgi:cytochrome b subunit of formate dehydrogenase